MDQSAIYALLRRRIGRRELLVQGGLVATAGMVACSDSGSDASVERPAVDARTSFVAIPASTEDRVVVPDGYTSSVLVRWGDSIHASGPGMPFDRIGAGSLLEPGAAGSQSASFGASCDGLGVVAIDENRIAICVNHETPEMGRMFPGWTQALRARQAPEFIRSHPGMVATMRASVGVSILEFARDGADWRFVPDSPLNRRITADTPIAFSGPAARHAWVGGSDAVPGSCLGTLGNCAAGSTPWGTFLTAEENTNDFFGNAAAADFDPMLARASQRFGIRGGPSAYRWEIVDERFDHARQPSESMKFGWIVEIDPLDPDRPVRKRTALGRFRHEGATTVLSRNDRPVVYMGDDSGFEYFYKFVGDIAFDPERRDRMDELLDVGRLYVARLDDDGTGEWLPLVYREHPALDEANGFSSQADVVLRCREAADLVGATPLDRPEDVAVHPVNGRVYLSCTMGVNRGESERDSPGADAANPRAPNPYGHILEFSEDRADAAALRFEWEVFILCGDPRAGLAAEPAFGRLRPADAYYAGITEADGLSALANPDNLGFDDAGNLWIVTDGIQPGNANNGCFVCATEGPERGAVRRFMSGPVGAEISGCTFAPDGETLFLTVQHPGSGSTIESPSSHWPDGGDAQPRSSLIAIRRNQGGQLIDS